MDAPKLKLAIGTWTPERLVKLSAALLLLAHLALSVAAARGLLFPAGCRPLLPAAAVFFLQLPLLIFCLAALWNRAPVRLAAGLFFADSIFWVYSGFVRGSGLHNYIIGGSLLATLALSALAFLRLPRHERW
jgi:hypothetical protein